MSSAATVEDLVKQPLSVEKMLSGESVTNLWTPGNVIFQEGEASAGIHVLRSGCIDLVFSNRNGLAKPLCTARRGQLLGLNEAMSRLQHQYTAVVKSPSETGFVSIADFLSLLDRNQALWFSVLRLLSQDLNQSWDSMRSMSSRSS